MFGDPTVNKWAIGPDGFLYAWELSDPVESDSYAVTIKGNRVMVSNFVYPDWFDDTPKARAVFDYMHRVSAPFSMSYGGYMIIASFDPNSEEAVFGKKIGSKKVITVKKGPVHLHFSEEMSEAQRTKKASKGSRGDRRAKRAGFKG